MICHFVHSTGEGVEAGLLLLGPGYRRAVVVVEQIPAGVRPCGVKIIKSFAPSERLPCVLCNSFCNNNETREFRCFSAETDLFLWFCSLRNIWSCCSWLPCPGGSLHLQTSLAPCWGAPLHQLTPSTTHTSGRRARFLFFLSMSQTWLGESERLVLDLIVAVGSDVQFSLDGSKLDFVWADQREECFFLWWCAKSNVFLLSFMFWTDVHSDDKRRKHQ